MLPGHVSEVADTCATCPGFTFILQCSYKREQPQYADGSAWAPCGDYASDPNQILSNPAGGPPPGCPGGGPLDPPAYHVLSLLFPLFLTSISSVHSAIRMESSSFAGARPQGSQLKTRERGQSMLTVLMAREIASSAGLYLNLEGYNSI